MDLYEFEEDIFIREINECEIEHDLITKAQSFASTL